MNHRFGIVAAWLALGLVAGHAAPAGASAGSPDATVKLGPWYCAGPFKDTEFGLHLRSFDVVFPPEKQALAAGGKLLDLGQTWEVTKYPGMTDGVRRWVRRDDWADGYRSLLPVGPAPMQNETCYLYRTIAANRAASVEMHVFAEDDVRAWLNGELLGEAHTPDPSGSSRFEASLITKLDLKAGEVQGCIGCHDRRDSAPPTRPGLPLAIRRTPSTPTYPQWTDSGIIDFVKVVQPVLDKHCVKCHSGPTPEKGVDLSGDKTHIFSQAYDQLLDRGMVHYVPVAGTGHTEGTAKARGSLVSRIRQYIETKHGGKPLPLEDRKRIYAWIDMNVPYYGTYEFTNSSVMGGRERWYVTDKKQWFQKDFLPVFDRRCLGCHKQTVTPQTYNYNPRGGTIAVSSKLWNDMALGSFQLGHGRISMIGQIGPPHRFNLTHPEWSQMLTAPLAKSEGGLGLCRTKEGGPVFKDKTDPDYVLILRALRKGADQLKADPRVDMLVSE